MIKDIDSLGNKLSKEQQEFFKDSKVVNNSNCLLYCYHGTGSKFTSFNQGINWFTVDKDYANEFAGFWGNKSGKYFYDVYLNCKNIFDCGNTDGRVYTLYPLPPYKLDERAKKLFNDLGLNDDEIIKLIKDVVQERVLEHYNGDKSPQMYEYNLKIHIVTRTNVFRKVVQSKGYDGIKTLEGGHLCFGVFKPNDIKLTFNEKPTNSSNINESNKFTINSKIKGNKIKFKC